MPLDVKMKYYELQETNGSIYYNSYYNSLELENDSIKEHIEQLKSGEYINHFVHLKEISEQDYLDYKGA